MADALERVARRIGLALAEVGGDHGPCWVDEVGDYACEAGQTFLRTYLLTGDRPLRVQVEYLVDCVTIEDGVHDGAATWYASAYSQRHADTMGGYGVTPAAAIIALAERIEGEGRE